MFTGVHKKLEKKTEKKENIPMPAAFTYVMVFGGGGWRVLGRGIEEGILP
jgi:hypothetical protein